MPEGVGLASTDRNIARDVDADGFLLVPFSDILPRAFGPRDLQE